jgi:hypothetical protein
MTLGRHFALLLQVVAVWGVFWLLGWPSYYQQYSTVALGVACTLLSVLISFAALWLLAATRPARRSARAFWLSLYYTLPFAVLDTLYCGVYLGEGAAYLVKYWYLTVFYLTPWLTFPPTAWVLNRLEATRSVHGSLAGQAA